MHFSLPDSQELYSDSTGTTYTAYNIYINGAFHCCLRYKQLHALHEQLRRRCCFDSSIQLPEFPPKRLLPLTNGQLETRRAALEHYLQLVGQDARIAKLEHLQHFLLDAQYETALSEGALDDFLSGGGEELADELPLEVLLTNGYQLQVNCRVRDSASALLQLVCQALQLPVKFTAFFCLYLMRRDAASEQCLLLRRLMDFEAPFVSRLRARPCHILLRTGYWSPTYDLALLQNTVALKLLYAQTVADLEQEWIITTPEVRQQLSSLQQHGLQREFLEFARHLPLYSCLQFATAFIDYPEPQTSALISIGNKELSMRTVKGPKIYETKFRVTRMRCWRVTALHNTTLEAKDSPPANLQLSFEYLMSKQTLRWITITSAQAMLMSVCLQAMVDELLSTSVQEAKKVAAANANATALALAQQTAPHNGRHSQANISSSSASSSTHSFSHETGTRSSATDSSSSSSSPTVPAVAGAAPTPPVQFITQRRATPHNPKISNSHSYAAVFFRNAQNEAVQQNEAFEAFGDDDL